jgi:ketosteroid isomerase-like protein
MTSELQNLRAEIGALYAVFEDCVNKKDVRRLVTDFYADPTFFEGTGVPLTTGAGLSPLLEAMISAVSTVRVEQLSTHPLGNGKDVVCDFSLVHATLPDGNVGTDRSCCIFVKTPKGWRCQVDVFLRP